MASASASCTLIIVLAGNCGACKLFKNEMQTIKQELTKAGIPFNIYEVNSLRDRPHTVGVPTSVANVLTWYPFIAVVSNTDLSLVGVFNGQFVDNTWKPVHTNAKSPRSQNIIEFFRNVAAQKAQTQAQTQLPPAPVMSSTRSLPPQPAFLPTTCRTGFTKRII